jgi:hypothetical protein
MRDRHEQLLRRRLMPLVAKYSAIFQERPLVDVQNWQSLADGNIQFAIRYFIIPERNSQPRITDRTKTIESIGGRMAASGQKSRSRSGLMRRPLWVKLRSPEVQPGSRLCLQERTSSVRPVRSEKCHRQTLVLYAMRVSKKKSASGLTNEFIATCSEFTCSPCCLTYSYAACSRSRSV